MPRWAVKFYFGANGHFRFISSAAIVAVMASSGSAVAANIVANGNFASGLSDWTTSWNLSGAAAITYAGTNWGDPNEDFPSYNGGPEVGEGCGDTWSCTLSQTLTTTPGQTYTLSFAFNPGNCVGTYPPQCNGPDGYVYLYGHQNFPELARCKVAI